MYKYVETKTAEKDWHKIKSMSKSVRDRFKYLFVDIIESPRNLNAVGSPEQLKHRRYESYSRELTKKDRIVFEIRSGKEYNMPNEREIVVFLQYLGHYKDT